MRVLLVEDDPTTQATVKLMLETAGMVVDATDLAKTVWRSASFTNTTSLFSI